MSHTCEAAIITCEDFRLHQRKDGRNYIVGFIKNIGVNCDLITRAGGIQDIVRPKEKTYCDCLLRDSAVSTKLHHANKLYIVNHSDCGAYKALNLGREEYSRHRKDMILARTKILKEFPRVSIKLFYAELQAGTEDIFIIREVD